jgi:hypothetical protein
MGMVEKRNFRTVTRRVAYLFLLLSVVSTTKTGWVFAQQQDQKSDELPVAGGPIVGVKNPDWAVFDGGGRIACLALPKLVISDAIYHLADEVKVYRGSQKGLSISALSIGDRVGFTLTDQRRINRIWILPKKK